MQRLLAFLRARWLELLLAAVLVLAAANAWRNTEARRREAARLTAILAAQAAHRRAADSTYFFTQGRRYEVQRQLDSLAHHAESPAAGPVPVLPARPAHQ